MNQVLFLCSGNYYRSRFAEILFNHLAEQSNLEWRAESRGIVAQWSHNPGPVSQETTRGLALRGIQVNAPRYPLQLSGTDLARADSIIALYEDEHRPMLGAYFSEWTERVEFWNVPDLGDMRAEEALALIELSVRKLVTKLLSHYRTIEPSHSGVSP